MESKLKPGLYMGLTQELGRRRSRFALFPAQNHFALPTIWSFSHSRYLLRAVLRPHPRRTAQQPHPGRRLKHVRRKRAAVHIKLHA